MCTLEKYKEMCELITRIMPCSYLIMMSPFCGNLHGNLGSLAHARKSNLWLIMSKSVTKTMITSDKVYGYFYLFVFALCVF